MACGSGGCDWLGNETGAVHYSLEILFYSERRGLRGNLGGLRL